MPAAATPTETPATTPVAINGFGRIGRCLLRALVESNRRDLEVRAINELADPATIRHLTQYDSTHGRFPGPVDLEPATPTGHALRVNDHTIRLLNQPQVAALPWRELGVEMVFECSGSFTDRKTAAQHLAQGAQRVLFSQPADRDLDATVVAGVNPGTLKPHHRIVSAASCTTNAITPVLQTLHRTLGIESGLLCTLHAAMHDQPVIDAYHHTDLRKTRAAFESMIPVDTALAAGIGRILPELDGRLAARAIRVPLANVSAMDATLQLRRTTTAADLNQILQQAAAEQYPGLLGYTEEPLASCDFVHDPHSGTVDASQTTVVNGRLAKLLIWFDNEWGYACRLIDVATLWLATAKNPQKAPLTRGVGGFPSAPHPPPAK